MPGVNESNGCPTELSSSFVLERYKYILQQLQATNENTHRFLGLFQALSTAIVGSLLALFVSRREWGIAVDVARTGVVGLLCLQTIVAMFTIILVVSGVLSWLDYRREEAALSSEHVAPGFRADPRLRNAFRWYETYIVGFIVLSTVFLWIVVLKYLIPNI